MSGSLKRLEDTTARFTNANFQEVSTHVSSGKDSSEARGSESKGKKSAGHSSGQRGRKPGAGRNPGTTVTAASPFQQGINRSTVILLLLWRELDRNLTYLKQITYWEVAHPLSSIMRMLFYLGKHNFFQEKVFIVITWKRRSCIFKGQRWYFCLGC